MLKSVCIIAAVFPLCAHAQMYKCTDPATGKTIFSQTRCATEAEAIDVNVNRPTPEQIEAQRQLIESNQKMIDEGIERRRAMRIEANRQQYAADLEAKHRREIAEIQAKRARASNNLAGATWEKALSQDEATANARYQEEMRRLRGE